LSLEDSDLAYSLNADLHSKPGSIVLRKGRTKQYTTALASAVRRLHKNSSTRYQAAGALLYRNQGSIASLTTGLVTLLSARPLGDTTTWTFVANAFGMYKDNGSSVRHWGITGPAAAPTLGTTGTGLTGDYSAVYTYARYVGTTLVHESNPSPTPSAQTLSNQSLTVAVTASSDAQVTHINIYRTVADGTIPLFDQQVANTTATRTSSQADSALGVAVDEDNDIPPVAAWCSEFQGHVFLCQDADNPHYLWYSKRFQPEAWPSSQFLEIGNPSDPLQCAVPLAGQLLVFSRQSKYRVLGNAVSGFTAIEAPSTRGTPAPQACLATEFGVVFVARDGLFVTNGLERDTELSAAIEPLFNGQTVNGYYPIDWDRADEISLEVWKGRLWFGYPTTESSTSRLLAVYSRDTQRWFMYDHAVRSLYVEEDVDALTAGFDDGLVYVLDSGSDDAGGAIALTVEGADRGSPWLKRRYDWQRFDVDAQAGTVTATLLVDGATCRAHRLTGRRTRTLLRLPGTIGHTWRQQFTYSGSEAIEIHGTVVAALPLEAIG
jgi:hypothetical protein